MKITIYNQFRKAQIGKVDFLKNLIICAIDSFETDLHLQIILKYSKNKMGICYCYQLSITKAQENKAYTSIKIFCKAQGW